MTFSSFPSFAFVQICLLSFEFLDKIDGLALSNTMPLPRRFIARCYDPTGRWAGRLRAALDASVWRVIGVDSFEQLLVAERGSAGASPSQFCSSPALLLGVLDEATAAEAARSWSLQRESIHPRSPLVIVTTDTDEACVAYWQELGTAAVLTTTLEVPLVVSLAERFAANRENLVPDLEHPLTPFWLTLPWAGVEAS